MYSDEYFLTGILLFLIIIAINTQIGWLFAVTSFLAAILLLSVILPASNLSKIEIKKTVPLHSFEGEKITVAIEMKNKGNFTKYLIILKDPFPASDHKNYKEILIKKIKPKEVLNLLYTQEAYLRGVYNCSESFIECATPFGLFWRKKKFHDVKTFIVYPRGPELKKMPRQSFSQYQASSLKTFKAKGESFDFSSIKKYQTGDEVKHIHWPLTAKYRQIMLKEFHKPSGAYINIILDNYEKSSIGRGRENSLEYIIKAAASLSRFCLSNNIRFSLKGQDKDGLIELSNPALFQSLEWLARITPCGKYKPDSLLENLQGSFKPYSHIILLATWAELKSDTLASLINQRVYINVVFFKGYSFGEGAPAELSLNEYEKTASLLKKLKINYKTISMGDDLKNCLLN